MLLKSYSSIGVPSPNIGDLKLVLSDTKEKLYEVMVYYTDGSVEAKWGAVCNDVSSINEAKVICQQAGKVLSNPYGHAYVGRYIISCFIVEHNYYTITNAYQANRHSSVAQQSFL